MLCAGVGQRIHVKLNVADGVSHVPESALSGYPFCSVPAGTAGATVFFGGTSTVAVAGLFTLADPSTFVPVTLTRTISPASAAVSVYVELVAPEM